MGISEPINKRMKLERNYSSLPYPQKPLPIIPSDIFSKIISYLEPQSHLAASLTNKNYFIFEKENLRMQVFAPYATFFSILEKDLKTSTPNAVFTHEVVAQGYQFLKDFLELPEDFLLAKMIENEMKSLSIKSLLDLRSLNTITSKCNEFISLFLTVLDGQNSKQDLQDKFKSFIVSNPAIEKMLKIREIALPLKDSASINRIFNEINLTSLESFLKLDCWYSMTQVIKKAYNNVKNENPADYQSEVNDYLMSTLTAFFEEYLMTNNIKTAFNLFEGEDNYFLATMFNSIIVAYDNLFEQKDYQVLKKESNFVELKYIYEKLIEFVDALTNDEKWEFSRIYFSAAWMRILYIYGKAGNRETFYSLLPNLITNKIENGKCCVNKKGHLIRSENNLENKEEAWSSLLDYDLKYANVNDFYDNIIKMSKEHALYERDYYNDDYKIPNTTTLFPMCEWILTNESTQKKNMYYNLGYQPYLFPLMCKLIDKKEFVKASDILLCLIKLLDNEKDATNDANNEQYNELRRLFLNVQFLLGSNIANPNAEIPELSELFQKIKANRFIKKFTID